MEPGSLSRSDQKFLDKAIEIAASSECRMRHGCVVTRHGKILATSPNISKNNPKMVNWKFCSIHAERAALRKAGYPMRAKIFVARINNSDEIRFSQPCNACMKLIEELKCKVVHT